MQCSYFLVFGLYYDNINFKSVHMHSNIEVDAYFNFEVRPVCFNFEVGAHVNQEKRDATGLAPL